MAPTTPPTFYHQTREENLLAAKRAVKSNRHSMLKRLTNSVDDVIDIIVGSMVLERHICKAKGPVVKVVIKSSFCVEEQAFYQ